MKLNKIFVVEYYYKYLSDEKKEKFTRSTKFDGRCNHDYEELLEQNGFSNIRIYPIQYYYDSKINDTDSMPFTLIVGENKLSGTAITMRFSLDPHRLGS